MKDFPNKRDFFYIVSFLIIAIIFTISGRLADNTNLIDYVGFAGTIVSILLAVIAIIYSFYQSSTYENATFKLDESARKIKKATDKLSNVSEIETMMNDFKGDVNKISSSIEDMKLIVEKVDVGLNTMHEKFDKGFQENFKSMSSEANNDLGVEYTKEFFNGVISNTSKLTLFLLLLINKFNKADMDIDLQEWTKTYYKHVEKKNYQNKSLLMLYTHAQVGILSAFSLVRFFDVENIEGDIFRVTNINNFFSESIEDEEQRILESEDDDKEGFKNVIKIVNKHISPDE